MARTAQTITTADGRAVCLAQWGRADGVPVLSMHGTPGCRLLWRAAIAYGLDELLDALGVRLLRYDRPGYGRSDRRPGRTIADSVDDVSAIADALGLERFSIHGGSFGTAHAFAAAAALGPRVARMACLTPMAPLEALGIDEWSRGQSDAVRTYVASILESEDRLVQTVSEEDAEMRAGASGDDPLAAPIFEQVRHGLGGWVDDELAIIAPWGVQLSAIVTPTRLYHDPADVVLPAQHARWLGSAIPGSEVIASDAIAHGSADDPRQEWRSLFAWLGDVEP